MPIVATNGKAKATSTASLMIDTAFRSRRLAGTTLRSPRPILLRQHQNIARARHFGDRDFRAARTHVEPWKPSSALVTAGVFRWLRNPMYVGFAAGWMGLWIVFGHPDPRLITAVAAVALGVHLFVVFYEEPTLRKKFGADYEQYSRNVRRWWPRWRGWHESHTQLGTGRLTGPRT